MAHHVYLHATLDGIPRLHQKLGGKRVAELLEQQIKSQKKVEIENGWNIFEVDQKIALAFVQDAISSFDLDLESFGEMKRIKETQADRWFLWWEY